ncbi:transporter [Natrialbaceae archaeon A-CW3]
MVRLSTIVILAGIVFLIVPIPPIGMALGVICLLLGIGLRVVGK